MILLGLLLFGLGAFAYWSMTNPVLGVEPTTIGTVLFVLAAIAIVTGVVGLLRGRLGLIGQLRVLPRMVKAIRAGAYPAPPWSKRLFWIFGVLYILSPIDLIPELLPVIGLTDDIGMGAFLLTQLSGEATRFVEHERRK
ncbi:YkvA family protein [Allokutzneria oryzae]|uniref:YkvA family protein n=1 Tax=Allokutzneria oryzae TaxID=1378989 RepID=A0ABV5ZV79_9PSEU